MIKDIMRSVANHVQAIGIDTMIRVADESVRAKNSLVREHGCPVAYHPDVGTRGSDVGDRMRYRYFAKMEYIKAQAKSMLQKTVRQRTRKLPKVEIGQMVFFWRDTHKGKIRGSKWNGPGVVVGLLVAVGVSWLRVNI